ncbi:O-fucosyltransferase family protein [Kineothrix sp. MB12-C1]|uniref:O-fucosyltransferase family protein n=1 Tax=Kineothrix sp. MB12-C1 TaxID=3070215 RepID=UPI0027D2D56A|nr:O-fucosyltransferase family protein [Kineothrix sp. MB12-C1]WMC91691.1 O-fucosyltransferase family protein [Kineothrix sp. MB12-C1]
MDLREQLKFLSYCIKKRNDTRFIKNVYKLGNEYNMVALEKGEQMPADKVVYHIVMEPSYSGFFADHNKLLSLLYFADYYGMIPVVEYGKEYSYAEDHPVNGTENPFEYYFMQPGGLTPEDARKYSVRVCSRKENSALAGRFNEKSGGYGMSEEYIVHLGRISEKYISLNEQTKDKVLTDIKELLEGKKSIGVHVRGTDFKQNYNGHPIQISTQEYLEETKRLLEKGIYELVFLATDDVEAIALFQKELGDKVRFYEDVTRSNGKETVMKSESGRENHHYLLGLEVLRDMYTLAACDGLIAGLSQVSYAARIQKAAQKEEYSDMVIINKGINRHRENCPT